MNKVDENSNSTRGEKDKIGRHSYDGGGTLQSGRLSWSGPPLNAVIYVYHFLSRNLHLFVLLIGLCRLLDIEQIARESRKLIELEYFCLWEIHF